MNKRGELRNMLLEFSCSNYKSIKDEITFSAMASFDDANEAQIIHQDSFRVLRSSVIYGANGSGKTNLINAIGFVKSIVSNSIKNQPGDGIMQLSHKLLGINTESTFDFQFTVKNIRYAFGFSLKDALVEKEYLFYYPKGRRVKIYERNKNEYIAGSKFKGRFDTCKEVLKENRLFLSCAANFSSVEEVATAFGFFYEDLVIYTKTASDSGNWLNYSLDTLYEKPNIKKAAIMFMQDLGIDVKDIIVEKQKGSLKESDFPPFLSDKFKAEFLNNSFTKYNARLAYDAVEINLLAEESSGIQKLIEFICPLLDIMIKGKVLICDELETYLHESIVYALVKFFNELKDESLAQIIFTTHNTGILNLELFRKDQIWFTELKKESHSTDLYSLLEIKDVRKDENISKNYIAGRYGAIPILNENLTRAVELLQNKEDANG